MLGIDKSIPETLSTPLSTVFEFLKHGFKEFNDLDNGP